MIWKCLYCERVCSTYIFFKTVVEKISLEIIFTDIWTNYGILGIVCSSSFLEFLLCIQPELLNFIIILVIKQYIFIKIRMSLIAVHALLFITYLECIYINIYIDIYIYIYTYTCFFLPRTHQCGSD